MLPSSLMYPSGDLVSVITTLSLFKSEIPILLISISPFWFVTKAVSFLFPGNVTSNFAPAKCSLVSTSSFIILRLYSPFSLISFMVIVIFLPFTLTVADSLPDVKFTSFIAYFLLVSCLFTSNLIVSANFAYPFGALISEIEIVSLFRLDIDILLVVAIPFAFVVSVSSFPPGNEILNFAFASFILLSLWSSFTISSSYSPSSYISIVKYLFTLYSSASTIIRSCRGVILS